MKITGIYYYSLAQVAQKGLKNSNGDGNSDVAICVAIAVFRLLEVVEGYLKVALAIRKRQPDVFLRWQDDGFFSVAL